MSTICKLDPKVRMNRTMRRTILIHPPLMPKHPKFVAIYSALMAKLVKIADDPALTGYHKHRLFLRGVRQLTDLGATA